MLTCRCCNSKAVSVAGAEASRNFVVRCRNPRCRAEYVAELRIADALAGLPRRALASNQPAVRHLDDYLDVE